MGTLYHPRYPTVGTPGGGGGGGGGTNYENVEVRPAPGAQGLLGLYIAGVLDGTFPASSLKDVVPQGHAPPAFSTTQAGLSFQAAQDRALAAQGDSAAMDRLKFSEGEAWRRGEFAEAEAYKRAQLEAAEAFKRQLMGEVGAGVRSQMEAEAAFRNMLGGEAGAGARAELGELGSLLRAREALAGSGAEAGLGAFTTQRGQRIGAVQDTFSQLRDRAAAPSDFLRLAYNAQGIEAPGSTPTDTARAAMRDFFANQTAFANKAAPTFADLYGANRATIGGATTLPSWGDLFVQGRDRIGGFGPAPSFADMFNDARNRIGGFEFGGSPSVRPATFRNAAITGEHGQPELVTGDNINVTPNLSKGEMAMLKRGGVGGKVFGDEPIRGAGTNVFDVPSLLQDFLRRRPVEQQMSPSQFGESIV